MTHYFSMMAEDPSTSVIDFKVSVVLPAGGYGDRFGCEKPKQYSNLLDNPLILHTITAFHRLSWIEDIVVVVHSQYITYLNDIIQDNKLDKVKVTEGCDTRHRSIHAGIKCLCTETDLSTVVIIHDVVRPFVDEDVIRKVAMSAKIYGAAGVTRPLVSTVIKSDDEQLLVESLDRTKYCGSEMPQGFVLDVIKTAYEKCDDYDFNYGTECLQLAMKYTNTRAKLIPGPDSLWKVTYKKDFYAAEGILKEKLLSTRLEFVKCCCNNDMVEQMKAACSMKSIQFIDNKAVSSTCNSTVYVYKLTDIFHTLCSDNTTVSVCGHNVKQLVKPCVLHVYDGCELTKEETFRFMSTISDLQHNLPDVLIFGILHFDRSNYVRLSEMTASLIWNRDKTLAGQTFIIQQ